jgi:anaerobic ribonucleoside-triphosphate reductase activating protein
MNTTINVARYEPLSEVNGPGRRAVVWVQGCPKRCKGCWNPGFLEFHSRQALSVDSLAAQVMSDAQKHGLEGITLSGGEPFAQAGALADLLSELHAADLTAFAFSGYTVDEIHSLGPDAERLLGQLDILVDGEYRHDLKCSLRWRSSTNQIVHFLTSKYRSQDFDLEQTSQEFEIHIDPDASRITGFPEPSILASLRK